MRAAMLLAPLLALGLVQAEEPLPVGGEISRPRRVKTVAPIYPPEAEARGIQSIVIVEITLDREGRVSAVRPLRGAPELVPAALEAVRQWEYEPTIVEGTPVSLRFAETVLFVLRKPAPPPPGRVGGNGMFLRPPAPGVTRSSYRDWELEGEAFTCCPCDTPCPCRSNAPPSHPPCHAATAQHFFRGRYGEVDLSGLTYVTLGPESWTAIYFEQETTPEQRQAVLDIYASMAPGAPQVYLSVKNVPLAYAVGPDRALKRVTIPGILEMASRLRAGPGGAVAGMDVWSNWLAYGETLVYRYHDAELGHSWDHTGRQSNHKTFTASKRLYDEGRMLIQHGDGSGAWTAGQQKLLGCLR